MKLNHQFFPRVTGRLVVVIMAGALLGLVACSKNSPWKTKDISGLMPNLQFTLTEANRDTTVTAKDYLGKVLLLYFGYTNCPDVCPTTLSRFKNIVSTLGPLAKPVRVLFVTVDPKRDTLEQMKSYTNYFGPEFIGLRGTQDELHALTKSYRVTYGYDKPDAHGNYEVSHSSGVYVFDTTGKARLLIRPTDSIAAIDHDLRKLLSESE